MEIGSTNHKGAVAEAKIAAAAMELGIDVLKPQMEHGRYDLLFDLGDRFMRVQWQVGLGARRGHAHPFRERAEGTRGFHQVNLRSTRGRRDRRVLPGNRSLLSRVVGTSWAAEGTSTELSPPKNGQRASIHLASEYEIGAVAQLGERRHGMAEVRGSSPLSSTPSEDAGIVVGAHEFRNRFGWCMERAAAGEEIRGQIRGRTARRAHGRQGLRARPRRPPRATREAPLRLALSRRESVPR